MSIAQDLPSTALTGSYGIMTLAGSNVSGTFSIGQTVSGAGVTSGTAIFQLGTGVGAAGTYYVSPSANSCFWRSGHWFSHGSRRHVSTPCFHPGSFIITSGANGAASLIAFASGSAAAPLLMTAATGAIISQGAGR